MSRPRRHSRLRLLQVEAMEPRQLLTVFLVTTTLDSGPGSLRQAILDANATPNDSPSHPDDIDFAIPNQNPDGSFQQVTISPISPLPAITEPSIDTPVSINGFTEPGSTPNNLTQQGADDSVLMVQIDGSIASAASVAGAPVNGFTVSTVNTTISGLSITGFSGAAIDLEPGPSVDQGAIGDVVWGNFIGVTSWDSSNPVVAGANPFANGEGVLVHSSNNQVGGNLPVWRNIIQGNNGPGVKLSGVSGTGNLVETNFILDNNSDGVLITTSNNYIGEPIGDLLAGAGNLISGNAGDGVHILGPEAEGNIILNNEIGTDGGNALDGVRIEDAPGNDVGGLVTNSTNVIAANGYDGVAIVNNLTKSATGNRVMGNWIGYNLSNGVISLMPNRDGIYVNSADNTIGGTATGAGNVIIHNARNGITISSHDFDIYDNIDPTVSWPNADPTGNVVEANYIGTQGGVEDYGNTLEGILIDDAPNNTIGGTAIGAIGAGGAGNLISGNNNGISIVDLLSSANVVEGNLIGTMADGVTVRGNAVFGIRIQNAPNNTIGGTATGAGNVISGNNWGLVLWGAGATQNFVEGNFIGTNNFGTDLTLAIAVRNAVDGILITQSATNNTIGGKATGAGNTIADNIGNGVTVASGIDNSILSNSIFGNNLLGIDLGSDLDPDGELDDPGLGDGFFGDELDGDGVTPNHVGVAVGPNNLLNYPVLTSATPYGPGITIEGTYNGAPNTTYLVQFFANTAMSRSGYGQGQTPIGAKSLTTDGNGYATFLAEVATVDPTGQSVVPTGQFIAATATDPAGDTSEFSKDVPAVPIQFQFSAANSIVNEEDGTATITVNRTGGSGQVSVSYATSNGTGLAGIDYTATSGTLNFDVGQTSRIFTIPLIDDHQVESDEIVNLALSDPTGGATLGATSTATLTIHDVDQKLLGFNAATYTVAESQGGATVTVTRNTGNGTASVDFSTTTGGTAIAGTDYTATSGTLNFAAGQTTRSFTIPLHDDSLIRPDQTVNLLLANPQGGQLGPNATAVLTIQDNNTPGTLEFGATTFSAPETGGAANVVVARVGGKGGLVTIAYATSGGNATPGQDYQPVSGTLTFQPGETSKTIRVPLVVGSATLGDRTFNVTLSNPTGGAALGAPAHVAVTILDNDRPSAGAVPTGPGPVVTGDQLIPSGQGIAAVVLDFNEALDPVRAQDLGNYGYFFVSPNPGGGYVAIASAAYDSTSFQVILIPSSPLPFGSFFTLNINAQANAALGIGLSDPSGVLLDGSGTGGSGTAYTTTFGVGPQLRYTDSSGNAVSLKLNHGLIEVQLGSDGNPQLVRLTGTVPGRTTLTGQVKHPSRRGGVPSPLPSLSGAAGVKLKLKGFSVGRISATAVDALLGAGLRARH